MFQRLVFVTSILCFATDAIPLSENTLSNLELVQIPLADGKELGLLSLTDENGRLTERNKRTIGILRDLFPELTEINDGNSAADQQGRLRETVRFIRQVAAENSIGENESKDVSNSESSVIDELTVDSSETEADERNKRFLFNFIGQSSGGGSGNFLFDVIRLFSSSGPNQSTAGLADDSGVSVTTEAGTNTADGYTETIPGPVTRLFVLANRGISNLIQDLILRIAQTSERVVNFKARLVTSLI